MRDGGHDCLQAAELHCEEFCWCPSSAIARRQAKFLAVMIGEDFGAVSGEDFPDCVRRGFHILTPNERVYGVHDGCH